MRMEIVESPRPLSASRLWNLLLEFYEGLGPEAWRRGTVPQQITANG